jgi:hypothetical protein
MLLLVGAAAVGLFALGLLLRGAEGHWQMAVSLHGLSVVIACLAARFLHGSRQAWVADLPLLIGLVAAIPGLGILLWGFLALQFRNIRPPAVAVDLVVGSGPELTRRHAPVPAPGTRQSVLTTLRAKDAPERRGSILALRSVPPRSAIPVLQRAIQDSDEQVRLMAQTHLQQILAGLETNIKKMEAVHSSGGGTTAEALLQLAEHYHELVFLGLGSEESKSIYLGRAIELLEQALATKPNEAASFLLYKCLLKLGRLDEAEQRLNLLRRGGMSQEMLLPWEAELHYERRDWTNLLRVVHELKGQSLPVRLRDVVEFWTSNRRAEAG